MLTETKTEHIEESHRDALLNKLSELLPTLRQDPTPATSLTITLILPERFNFTRVLSITPPVDFVAGLTSPLSCINLATLCLLETAKYRTSDIGIVAGEVEVVGSLIKLWLCTHDTTVARKAHHVLLNLLVSDRLNHDLIPPPVGHVERGGVNEALLWRRILRDKDIYGSMFSICSLTTAGQAGQPSKRHKTVAQARLFDMILDIEAEPFRISQMPEVEQRYGVTSGGLLHFAAIHMVDFQDDVLMHMTLIDFFINLLRKNPTFALPFLRDNGLHTRTMGYYLDPDKQNSLDIAYLYGSSAKYLSMYCSTCPDDLLKSHVPASILHRLTNVLQNVSPGQWSQGQTPKHDLHLLVHLPLVTLLPRGQAGSPLFLIGTKPANADAFGTLATVFQGSPDVVPHEESSAENNIQFMEQDRAAARALYFLYMEENPNFWNQVVSAAEVVALKDVALTAISLMGAVINAQWAPLPTSKPLGSQYYLLTEEELATQCHSRSKLPTSGVHAIMVSNALANVLPYLMKPAQTFSNLVGGGRGDVESAAYRVAVAKHDVLALLHQKLKEEMGNTAEAKEMIATVGRRVAQGPMGGTSEVGGRVGTMER